MRIEPMRSTSSNASSALSGEWTEKWVYRDDPIGFSGGQEGSGKRTPGARSGPLGQEGYTPSCKIFGLRARGVPFLQNLGLLARGSLLARGGTFSLEGLASWEGWGLWQEGDPLEELALEKPAF
jgi:hypothetical protein